MFYINRYNSKIQNYDIGIYLNEEFNFLISNLYSKEIRQLLRNIMLVNALI